MNRLSGQLFGQDRVAAKPPVAKVRRGSAPELRCDVRHSAAQGFRLNLKEAQARRMIVYLRGDHQPIHAGLLDESVQIRTHHLREY